LGPSEIRAYPGHAGPINALNFSLDGRLFVSAADDGAAFIWEFKAPSNRALPNTLTGPWPSPAPLKDWSGLAQPEPKAWAPVFDALLGLGDQGLDSLLEGFPPERPCLGLSAEEEAKILAGLEDEDFDVRQRTVEELEALGPKGRFWAKEKLVQAARNSLQTRGILGAFLNKGLPSFALGDRGRLRAVLLLLEMEPTPAVLDTLRRYAQGPSWSYPAQLARRRLRAGP
jgi:hypothetical protein